MQDQSAPLPAPELYGDRRAASQIRLMTTLLIGRVVTPHGDGLCRVRNLSEGGARIETGIDVHIDEYVSVELRGGLHLVGRVAWRRENAAGLQFFVPVPCEALLTPLGKADQKSRGPRLATDCHVFAQERGVRIPARMLNISLGGAMLEINSRQLTRHELIVDIPELGQLFATVQWHEGRDYGVHFSRQIGFADLSRWLQQEAVRYSGEAAG